MELKAEDPQLLRRVAQQLEKHEFKGWFYGDSVGFEGLVAAGDMLGESLRPVVPEQFGVAPFHGRLGQPAYRAVQRPPAGRADGLQPSRMGDRFGTADDVGDGQQLDPQGELGLLGQLGGVADLPQCARPFPAQPSAGGVAVCGQWG